ncbi:helix-turn-helix domain-containing protein [Schaalia sp. HMT 180]|nr:helix-turn-helix domain-containing protein [Schaalia sp. ORNL0103]
MSESTLYALRRAGDGPRYAKRGQLVRYSIADLDAWMRQNMENSHEDE